MAVAVPTFDPRDELVELHAQLGSQSSVARVLGKQPAQIWQWLHEDRPMRPSNARLINDVWAVTVALGSRELGTTNLEQVLSSRWPMLNMRRPVDLIPEQTEEVLRVIDDMPQKSNELDLDEEIAGFGAIDAGFLALERELGEHGDSEPGLTVGDADTVDEFLAVNADVSELLPQLESRLSDFFDGHAGIDKDVIDADGNGEAQFHVRVISDLDFEQALDALGRFLVAEEELLAPFAGRVAVGLL